MTENFGSADMEFLLGGQRKRLDRAVGRDVPDAIGPEGVSDGQRVFDEAVFCDEPVFQFRDDGVADIRGPACLERAKAKPAKYRSFFTVRDDGAGTIGHYLQVLMKAGEKGLYSRASAMDAKPRKDLL